MEQWCFVSIDRLSPDFRRRVSRLKLKRACAACDRSIATADRVALIMLRDSAGALVCAHCGALPRDELIEKLDIVEGAESDPTLFVAQAKQAECVIALCCGLNLETAIDWNPHVEWDYGLGARFGLVRKGSWPN